MESSGHPRLWSPTLLYISLFGESTCLNEFSLVVVELSAFQIMCGLIGFFVFLFRFFIVIFKGRLYGRKRLIVGFICLSWSNFYIMVCSLSFILISNDTYVFRFFIYLSVLIVLLLRRWGSLTDFMWITFQILYLCCSRDYISGSVVRLIFDCSAQ